MITNISHNLDLYNINTEITSNDIENLIITDNDILEFTYKGIPFRMLISDIRIYEKNHYVQDFNNRAEAIEACTGILVKTDEDLEFHWNEITYKLGAYEALQIVPLFRTLWFFNSEFIDSDENSIIFYAHQEEESEEIIYSLEAPAEGAQKVKLVFNKNVSQIFENLQNVKMNFTVNLQFTWARIESENIFLRIASMCVNSKLKLEKLTPSTEHNYYLFFDLEFSCIVKDGKAIFTIGNFTFEYEF